MANFLDDFKGQGQFISVIPDEQITEGSFDETVQLLIDDVLDLSDFEAGYTNDRGGAPAYPPSVLLKVILAAYSRGITGSRRIEHLCKYHTTFMCLAGFLTPDHSTIAAFVSKSPTKIEGLFVQVVLECDELGLVGGNSFSIDGTKLSSNASKEQSGTLADFERKYKKCKRAVRYLLKQHHDEDQQGHVDPDRRSREKKRIKKLKAITKKLEKPLAELEDKVSRQGKPRKTNLTDPDSHTMMSGGGGAQQGYMGVAVGDDLHQVITAAGVAEESEQKSFIPLLEQVEDNLGVSLKDKHVLADAGFHTIENVDYCYDNEIDAYIADGKMRKRNPLYEGQEDKKPAARKRKYFLNEDFSYDEESNSCQCPAGKMMWLSSEKFLKNGQYYRRFAGYLNDCKTCPLQKKCMRQPPTVQGRQVSIRHGTESNPPRPLDLMKEKVDSPVGRDIYAGRMGAIEPVFANIKHMLGLRWLSLRGQEKVNGQWLLFCMVHNMVKIQRYGEYKPI
jgi:transposase